MMDHGIIAQLEVELINSVNLKEEIEDREYVHVQYLQVYLDCTIQYIWYIRASGDTYCCGSVSVN